MILKFGDVAEPIIFCTHNLDISNANVLASQIASTLGVSITIYKINDEKVSSIELPNAIEHKKLYIQNSKFENDFSYVLEHGDEAILFYKNHLQYELPFIANFYDIKDNENIYKGISDLKMFGADKVYVGNINELNLTIDVKHDWSKLLLAITNSNHHIINLK